MHLLRLLALLGLLLAWASAGALELTSVGELQRVATMRVPAEAVAQQDATLSAEIAARIEAIPVDVGRRVAAGELLLRLDDTDARLALARADAELAAAGSRLELAEQRLARGRDLHQRKHLSDDELLALETERAARAADRDAARVRRDEARAMLARCELRAPFAATVAARHAQLGALAAPGTPLLRLVSLAPPELSARLPAAEDQVAAPGTAAVFEAEGRRWPVRLAGGVEAIDPASRTRELRLAFDSEAPLPGTAGLLLWPRGKPVLPARLLVRRGGELGVFLAADGVARFHAMPGAQEGRDFTAALPADALVVSEGQQALEDGQALDAAP